MPTPNPPTNMSILFTGRKFFQKTVTPAPAMIIYAARFPAVSGTVSDLVPPTKPGTPVGTPNGTQIAWTWTASTDTGGSGFAGYRVYLDGAASPATTVATNSYTSSGHAAFSIHSLRVEAFDNAGNTTFSDLGISLYRPDAPWFGSYAIGGSNNASDAALAGIHVNVVNPYPGWQQSKGTTWSAKCISVKALSTNGTLIFPYTILPDLLKVAQTPPQAFWEVDQILRNNNLWTFQNGANETNQITSDDSAYWKANYTLAGKAVGGLPGERYYQTKLRYDYKLNVTGGTFNNGQSALPVAANLSGFAGTYLDNYFSSERPSAGSGGSITGDYDRDGIQDNLSSVASRNLIQSSNAAASSFYRTLKSDALVIGNSADWPIWYPGGITGLPIDQTLDGGVLEHIQEWLNGTRGSTGASIMNAIKVQMDGFRGSKLGVLSVLISGSTAYSELRYWHCIACLTTTYYYPHLTTSNLAEELGSLNWDEKSFLLGQPIDGPQYTPRYQSGANGIGIYRRDFDNGIVLWAAPGATYGSQALGATFYRILGTLDASTNNGQSLTSWSPVAGQGIVLRRTPPASSGGFTPASGIFSVSAPNGFAHGQPMTVSRSTGSWAARQYSPNPWIYDIVSQQWKDGLSLNIHSGRADGSAIPAGGDTVWDNYNANAGAASVKYSTSRPKRHQFVTAVYLQDVVNSAMKMMIGPGMWPPSWNGGVQNNARLYLSWQSRDKFAYTTEGGSYQHKLCRYNSTSGQGIGSCEFNPDSFQFNGTKYSGLYWIKASNGQHVRYEMYLDRVNGIAEGYTQYRFQRGGASGFAAPGFPAGEFEYRSQANALYDANPNNIPFLPGWANIAAAFGYDGNTSTHTGQEIEVGEIYMDTEFERFEITDSSTWNVAPAPTSNPTGGIPREIQGRWSRDSASVCTVYINQGAFASLSGKYLWYVDGFKTATLIGQFN